MLYTAVTRTVETVVLVGDPDLLNEVVSMAPRSLERNSASNFVTP
jgi:exodeoxyribonuclease V alpha subunit